MIRLNFDADPYRLCHEKNVVQIIIISDIGIFWQTYLVVLEHNIVRPEVPVAASINGCLHLTHKQVQLFPSSYTEKFSHSEAQKNILANDKNYDQNFRTIYALSIYAEYFCQTRITKVNFEFQRVLIYEKRNK